MIDLFGLKIPESWTTAKSKRFLTNTKVRNANYSESNVLSLTLRGVVRNDLNNPEGLVPEDYSTYQIFEKDDLVFKLIDLENIRTSRVGIVPERGVMSSAYIRLIPSNEIFPKFAYWWFYNLWCQNVFNALGGGVRANLSASDLLDLPFSKPAINEQKKIANYLDKKVQSIDELIKFNQRIILMLEELDRSFAFESLIASVKFDATSGFKIQGQNEKWQSVPLGTVCSEVKNKNSELVESNLLSLSYGRIIQKDIESTEGLLPESFDGYNIVDPGDIVLRLTDLQNDQRSLRVGYVQERGIITSAYTTLRTHSLRPAFLSYQLKAFDAAKFFYALGGGLRQSMKFDDLKSLPILVLPPNEQEVFLAKIDNKYKGTEKIRIGIKKQIEGLKQLKISLIASCVLGSFEGITIGSGI